MSNLVNTQAEKIDRTRRNLTTLTTTKVRRGWRWRHVNGSTPLYNEDDVMWTLV